MLKIMQSGVRTQNKNFREVKRKTGENNLQWLQRNLPNKKESTSLVLLGGMGSCDFRLRVAQSHARDDMTPSHWSHVLLLGTSVKKFEALTVYEISLKPMQGFGFPVSTNAVQEGTLSRYSDSKQYPNIALLSIPTKSERVYDALSRFKRQRNALDACELVVVWLAFVWGVGRTGNPLLDGHGIPSAAMVEAVVSDAGFELTPGLSSRSSCPEAIWQSARWWHEYHTAEKRKGITGAWCVEHKL